MVNPQVSNVNQRANRKVVFKGVLDSPFKVAWPYVPLNVQNMALASLVTILAGVGEYHLERRSASKKRKRARHDKQRKEKIARKRSKNNDEQAVKAVGDSRSGVEAQIPSARETPGRDTDTEPEPELPPPPSVIDHLVFGVNQVTKRLETQAHSRRLRVSLRQSTAAVSPGSSSVSKPEPAPLTFVFVCRADIDPPLLIAHLPELVATCNVPLPSCQSDPVYLISLPMQAEHTLAEATGLRRVAVLALDSATPSLDKLSSLLAAVQPPTASWLLGPIHRPPLTYVPTHIKQLRTSAPQDMRVAKQRRNEGRRVAREKNKAGGSRTIVTRPIKRVKIVRSES